MTNSTDDNMESNEHPADQAIQDYLLAPAAETFAELRLHLAGCRHCRRRAELMATLREQGHWLESGVTEADPRIEDLVAGRLSPSQASQLQQEIKQDPAALRAALHYASHAQAMHEITAEQPRDDSFGGSLLGLLKHWLSFEAPLWQTVPALAVVMAVTLLLLQPFYPAEQDSQASIVAFRDEPVLRFASQETQPGIGFFSQQSAADEAFDGMKIELLADNRLRLAWPAIAGANDYNLKLQVFRDGESRVLARLEQSATEVELQFDEALTQHRYEWVLSGSTRDNRSFQTSGGFVITRD